ncbi:MAG TPA: GNAT family N-acetyltransferase [Acidimicrobiia bacterium]|nr:GNAT family N-acetyltransferase [Acidimicrobiia bacterium]
MEVSARAATLEDLEALDHLYRALEEEMVAIHPMWPLADGLPEPVDEALNKAIADPDAIVTMGLIDGVSVGFLLARVEDLLPQAEGRQIGSIQLVFVDREAREVGVGEEMLALTLAELRGRGLDRFDAHVLPGHRLVKNFFEAGGFAARSIIMHHAD